MLRFKKNGKRSCIKNLMPSLCAAFVLERNWCSFSSWRIFCHLCLFSSSFLQPSNINLSISVNVWQRQNDCSTDYDFLKTPFCYTYSNWTDRKVEFWKKVWQCLTMCWNNRILSKLHFLDKSDKVDMVADFLHLCDKIHFFHIWW